MPFQRVVNTLLAPAVLGDFASQNPWASVDAGPGGLIAGAAGVTVGHFAWLDASNPNLVNNFQPASGAPVTGFVRRAMEGLVTTFLGESGLLIQSGYPVTLMTLGDFWALNEGATVSAVMNKCYANVINGRISFGATGTPSVGWVATGTIAPLTMAGTGSITDNVLNVTAATTANFFVGATITGAKVYPGTQITGFISGTSGGVGFYNVSIAGQNVPSTAISGTIGLLTIGAPTTGGPVRLSDPVTGTNVKPNTNVTALGTGTGGAGTYYVDPTQTVASTTLTGYGTIETKWYCMSQAAPGELAKISATPLG